MSISPITGSFISNPISSRFGTFTPAPVSRPDPTIKTVVDTVKLSQQAQIQLLTQQGISPTQIANTLGVPLSTIDADLYIAIAQTTASTATTKTSTPISTNA